jgi:alkylation response protein AidB-like acyl-CoA dehydrogenase
MPESLQPDLIELRDAMERFARDVLTPTAQALTDGTLTPDDAHAQVREASRTAGFFTMTQPKAFGGSEAGQLALTVARDTLAAHNSPVSSAVFGPGPGVLAGVEEPLRSSHLEPLMRGEKRAAFGFTEPDDAPHPTQGVVQGDELIVNGQKSYVTGGAHADFINVLVTVVDQGPAMLVLDRDTPGVSIERTFESLDGSHHAAFRFVDVKVPCARLIGKPGEGLPRAMRQIGDTRLAIAAGAVGLMRWVLDLLTEHLSAPHASGEPLGNREGVRLRYADLRIKAYAARSMLYRTARLADSGANIVNEGIACKVFSTEALGEIVDTSMQLVGGKALTVGHPLERLYREVRVLRLTEGASDVLRLNLARGRLDLGKGTL